MSQIKRVFFGLPLAILLSLAIGPNHTAAAGPSGPGVQVTVKGSVDETVSQIRKLVADSGMMIMGELHQGKVIGMTGLKLQSETVFVGSPTIGKELFAAQPGVGLVVPIRINVYASAQGHTVVSYVKPSQELAGFGDEKVNHVAAMLDESFAKMVGMLAK